MIRMILYFASIEVSTALYFPKNRKANFFNDLIGEILGYDCVKYQIA